MIRSVGSVLVVFTVTTGCATASHPVSRDAPEAVTPPTLIECADFNSPETDLSREFVDVVVPVRVSASGSVIRAGAPRASRQSADRQLLDRAISLAQSCHFEPATSDGERVAATTDVRFRMGVG